MSSTILQFEAVNFSYRALPVLRNLQWQVNAGEQWACLGPNGAGKTTLAKLITGQLRNASGALHRDAGLEARGIAYVCFEEQKTLCDRDRQLDDSEFRSDASDPGTTVLQAITRGGRAEVGDWPQRLGIAHILDRGIRFISTGEMRKTLLLRALLSDPGLLILDSPLDGLDRQSQEEMRAVIEQLLASDSRLLILCRSLGDLPAGASHVLVLNEGEVLAQGPAQDVLAMEAVQALMQPPLPALGELPTPTPREYTIDATAPLLQLRNVSVAYGDVQVLESVDWTFDRGQHCCIAGPNGCGKTTLLSLVNGDNHKAYGQDITLFGRRRGSGESVWDIKQKFGVLNTQLHLGHVRGMRVLEVVVSGFFDSVGLYDDWGDRQRHTARAWLDALGMSGLERQPFDTLSFGLQRMVLLARAMVKSPVILILDEPCLGLDGFHKTLILRAIDHIAAQSDTQILYVSHSAGETPACVNQWLDFEPGHDGFTVRVRTGDQGRKARRAAQGAPSQ